MPYRRLRSRLPVHSLRDTFGIRSRAQVRRDLRHIAGELFTGPPGLSPSTAGLFRPELGVPAYLGLVRRDGVSPIFNLFDRTGGGQGFRSTVTRDHCLDYRGGRLTYDEHDGTDFVCPPGSPVVSAAPGVVVATRDTFYRGGLTACVDHGGGVVTQYTHLTRMIADVGQPVQRGELIAVSGSAGIDMISGFPFVPPHVHFMVWVAGRPVDPFLAPGERSRRGTWVDDNEPRASGPRTDDQVPGGLDALRFDEAAVDRIAERCVESRIRDEIEALPALASRVAVIEDSLHHDRKAWPDGIDPSIMRPRGASAIRISLPLSGEAFERGAPFDARWTRA